MANAQGKAAGPVATYVMTASTDAGMSGGAASMMSAMMGGGSSATRRLNLYLGSTRKAAGEAKADHIPPAALKAGATLPLLSGPPKSEGQSGGKLPSGKVRVYWGCGEKAAAGQPCFWMSAKWPRTKRRPRSVA
ncbi:hypothetical protein [Allosphingosinicella vermicomposti]|uniref:hypothetical protein n=1 Tax=Allosphingosinicella vermicomposti TaxID=614671 RepID=UPI000D0FEC7F|nr:hypothetical protein [Allosphingosinicella vermicomposti]